MSDQLRLIELLVDRYQPFRDLIMNACEHGSAPVSTCCQPNCEAREMLRLLNLVLQTRPLQGWRDGRTPPGMPRMAHWEGSRKTKINMTEIADLETYRFPQANLLVLLYRHGIPMRSNPSGNSYTWMPTNEDMLDLIDLPAWRTYNAEPHALTFEYYRSEDAAALRDKYVQPGAR